MIKRGFLFVFLVFLVPSFGPAQGLRLKILSVYDGDTLTAVGVQDGRRYKVRLMGVDTPEVDFQNNTQGDAALAARDFLRSLIPADGIVTLSDDSQLDKYGRIIGRLLSSSTDINIEMLRSGWGFLYFIYPFEKRIVSDFSKASKEAFDSRRGVFSSRFSVEEPYIFRMRAQKQASRNPVGDFEDKRLYPPEEVHKIPVWKRVFFPSYESANRNGYK